MVVVGGQGLGMGELSQSELTHTHGVFTPLFHSVELEAVVLH